MYVIIPCITDASKPNERLYQNDRLHYTEEEIRFQAATFRIFHPVPSGAEPTWSIT